MSAEHAARIARDKAEAREEEIEHLDFDVEEKKHHVAHPTDPELSWCGEKITKSPGEWRPGLPGNKQADPPEITCVACLQIWVEKGTAWWWRVNKAWYGS